MNAEKDVFETQLAGALAQLRGVEAVIEGRAAVEKQNKQSQNLWAACQSLNTAIDKGVDQPGPLLPQLTAIHEAAAEDPLRKADPLSLEFKALRKWKTCLLPFLLLDAPLVH